MLRALHRDHAARRATIDVPRRDRSRARFGCRVNRSIGTADRVADRARSGRGPAKEVARAHHFVLDIIFFSSIIYSLYEPGSLSPALVIVSGR